MLSDCVWLNSGEAIQLRVKGDVLEAVRCCQNVLSSIELPCLR